MSRKLTTEEYHRLRGAEKQKHLDSMTYGRKNASDKAREWFRRPAYGSFEGRVEANKRGK